MPTNKKRINLTLSKPVDHVLTKIARRDGVPTATKAVELLSLALEIEEDVIWDRLASSRDEKKGKFVSHDQAWV